MTRPNPSRTGFFPVFAIAATALVFAGTIVVSAEKSDPVPAGSGPSSVPASHPQVLWNIG